MPNPMLAAVVVALVCAGTTAFSGFPQQVRKESGTAPASKRMLDGNEWTTENLAVDVDGSFCYENADAHCRRYGRLYTWDAAQRACRALGEGWRLPSNDDWQRMARGYGGVRGDSADEGKAAFAALIIGGSSGFNAVFGGGRDTGGEYARVEAHGFYWTATESGPGAAWFYNLGKNGQFLNRHAGGEKDRALAVRCVRDTPSASFNQPLPALAPERLR